MNIEFEPQPMNNVALRKESVDRNIVTSDNETMDALVALRKESVDRNKASGGF